MRRSVGLAGLLIAALGLTLGCTDYPMVSEGENDRGEEKVADSEADSGIDQEGTGDLDKGSDSQGESEPAGEKDGGVDSGNDGGNEDGAGMDDGGSEVESAFEQEGAAEESGFDSGYGYGWVKPRCGDGLVNTCSECPGKPYVCSACKASATCVADCKTNCSGKDNCPDNGVCLEGKPCSSSFVCSCPPPQKRCTQSGTESCVDDCNACPGKLHNTYGVCNDLPESIGGCPDQPGPEHYCFGVQPDHTGKCADACAECGSAYCIGESCDNQFCREGYLPDEPYYICRKRGCCDQGFRCPATNTCVTNCADCPGHAAGACGERGQCVSSCSECFQGVSDTKIEVCDGVCSDILSDARHCGKCNAPCKGGTSVECSSGHCCAGSPASYPPPWTWCETCNCCLSIMHVCVPQACTNGCVK